MNYKPATASSKMLLVLLVFFLFKFNLAFHEFHQLAGVGFSIDAGERVSYCIG